MRSNLHSLAPALAFILAPIVAAAQINNGGFENGDTSWAVSGSIVDFVVEGGNPGGYVFFSGLEETEGSIQQRVEFPAQPGRECRLAFDLMTAETPGGSPKGGYSFLIIQVGSEEVYHRFLFRDYGGQSTDWNTMDLPVPCGTHDLRITLLTEATAGHAGCFLGIDNVTAINAVPTTKSSWGALKSRY